MARGRRIRTPRGDRVLTPPPPDHEDVDPTLETLAREQRLVRIYAPEPYDTGPVTFCRFGPLNRFDHHRSANGPGHDEERGILYAGYELVCGVGEYFGDEGAVTRAGNRLHAAAELPPDGAALRALTAALQLREDAT